jgi:hypothetical protein
MEHARLQRAMFAWVDTHPTNGRFILCNGFDWSYFTVEHTAFFVESIAENGAALEAHLSNGLRVPLRGDRVASAPDEGLYLEFDWAETQSGPQSGLQSDPKPDLHDDAISQRVPERFWAKFTRHAALALGEHLDEAQPEGGDKDAGASAAAVELAGTPLRQLAHVPPARVA